MKKETNELALRNTTIRDIKTISQLFAESGYFPDARSMAQAFVKIQAGRELGIAAMASMTGISIIKGKPVAGANIIAAKVKMSGYDYRVKRLDNEGCIIEFLGKDGDSIGTSEFTKEDAERADLLNKDNWVKYARNMYFARAISNGQRWFCPDATQGQLIYAPDELGGKVDQDGDPILDDKGKSIIDAEIVTETLDDIIPHSEEQPEQIVKPPAKSKPSLQKEKTKTPKEMRDQCERWLEMLYGDDDILIGDRLFDFTKFKNADGDEIPGKRNLSDIKDTQMWAVYKQLKEVVEIEGELPF